MEVNGKNHTMWKKYDWDNDYTDGVLYEFNATADELGLDRLGYYNYCFYAFNGTVLYRRPIGYDEYFDFELVNTPPELYPVENLFEPKIGFPNTEFIFRVNYTDIDNDRPKFVKIRFLYSGNDINITIEQEDKSDTNYKDGVIFIAKIKGLPCGQTKYYFITSDIHNSTYELYNNSEYFKGPYIAYDERTTSFIVALTTIIIGLVPLIFTKLALQVQNKKYQILIMIVGLIPAIIYTIYIIVELSEIINLCFFGTNIPLTTKFLIWSNIDTFSILLALTITYGMIFFILSCALLFGSSILAFIGLIISIFLAIILVISYITGQPILSEYFLGVISLVSSIIFSIIAGFEALFVKLINIPNYLSGIIEIYAICCFILGIFIFFLALMRLYMQIEYYS